MEDISAFTDKKIIPDDKALANAIGKTYALWNTIKEYVYSQYPEAVAEWNYPGVRYGWSFRMKDKKRAVLYFLPRSNFFKVAFVFGEKATNVILESTVSEKIKDALTSARVYAEGRGIRLDVNRRDILKEVEFLIDVKLKN